MERRAKGIMSEGMILFKIRSTNSAIISTTRKRFISSTPPRQLYSVEK